MEESRRLSLFRPIPSLGFAAKELGNSLRGSAAQRAPLAAAPHPKPLPRQSRLSLRHAAEPRDEPEQSVPCNRGVAEGRVGVC